MKPDMENMSAQQSLDIITSMIRQAKGNVKQNSFYFLLWGWVIVTANISMFVLTWLRYPYPYIVWSITIPAWIISFYKGYKSEKEKRTSTHLDTITMWLWIMFGVCIFTLVAFGSRLNHQLNPLIITISSIPTMVSGVVLRFKPLMLGSGAFWIFGIIGFLSPREIQPLVGAAAILCGYLVPGYLLKNRKD